MQTFWRSVRRARPLCSATRHLNNPDPATHEGSHRRRIYESSVSLFNVINPLRLLPVAAQVHVRLQLCPLVDARHR